MCNGRAGISRLVSVDENSADQCRGEHEADRLASHDRDPAALTATRLLKDAGLTWYDLLDVTEEK
jgi:hypothetical protein